MNLKKNILDSNAVSIGKFAIALLAQPGKGRVMGVTSRGFFLLTRSDRVLFLTADLLQGPLNLILTALPEAVKARLMGTEVECSPDKLYFPQTCFRINLKDAKTWQPPELPKKIKSAQERNGQIKSVAHAILKSEREATFLPLLKWIVTPNLHPKPSDYQFTEFIQKAVDLQWHIHENESTEAGRILDSFLGYGPGLTPSGDDFVWGFLAALNRWQAVLCPQFVIGRLNEIILSDAKKKTSFLSATLIECATHGWADANMLKVLDCLFSGEGSMDEMAEKILAYGSSSGVDAFAGMLAAIKASKN